MGRARVLALATIVLFTLSLAGCLDYREQMTLRKDGSGRLTIDFVVNLGLMTEIAAAFGDKPDPNSAKGPSREEILQGLRTKGLRVRELRVKHKGDKSKVHLDLEFDSLDALREIEGFGDDRKVEFFDNGDGRVRVVYSFDTSDVIPLEELGDEPPEGGKLDPIEKKILEITGRARDELRFMGRIEMPGAILKSNGNTDAKQPNPNVRIWRIDKKNDPKRHRSLGRGKIIMKMLVERSTVPWVKDLQPMPGRGRGRAKPAPHDRRPPRRPPGPLGDD